MKNLAYPTHEEGEVITLGDMSTAVTRELSQQEVRQIENENVRMQQEESVAGTVLWYELEWSEETGGAFGLLTYFTDVNEPIAPEYFQDLTDRERYPSGTKFELYCYSGENAIKHIEENTATDSLLLTAGRMALDPTVQTAVEFRVDSLVTFWVKN